MELRELNFSTVIGTITTGKKATVDDIHRFYQYREIVLDRLRQYTNPFNRRTIEDYFPYPEEELFDKDLIYKASKVRMLYRIEGVKQRIVELQKELKQLEEIWNTDYTK